MINECQLPGPGNRGLRRGCQALGSGRGSGYNGGVGVGAIRNRLNSSRVEWALNRAERAVGAGYQVQSRVFCMRYDRKSLPLVPLFALAGGLFLSGCSSFSMPSPSWPSFGGSSADSPPPPPVGGALPSKYSPEELVGRWGFTSYQKEADRARTINTARGLCRSPYVINKGPSGGVMMHLADERQAERVAAQGQRRRPQLHRSEWRCRRRAGPRDRVLRRPGLGDPLCRSGRRQPLWQHGLRALRARAGITAKPIGIAIKRSPGFSSGASRVYEVLLFLEAIVHARAHDVVLQIDVGRCAASRHAARVVAEVDVEVFDLGRPIPCDHTLDAGANGPAHVGGA